MNKPVNKKIAILLKEKGWKKDCKNYYTLLTDTLKQSKGTNLQKSERIQAPIISNVVMFLYKKHGIWIFCDRTPTWFWTIQKATGEYIYHEDQEPLTDKICNGFNSPTEAYEAAIEYSLKQLV